MSRKQLLEAARNIGLPTDARRGGKRGSRDSQWLRSDILTACYGPLHSIQYPTPEDADTACVVAAQCKAGELGYALLAAQKALKDGMAALLEWRNASYLGPREFDTEHEHLAEARECFAMVRAAQSQHEGTLHV